MDPNLFRLDWDQIFEVLVTIIVLSFFVERALALVFEHRYYVDHIQGKGIKEPIAFVVALVICIIGEFDAVSIALQRGANSLLGQFITAGIIAGGSKGSIKLFHDVMDARSTALKAKRPRP